MVDVFAIIEVGVYIALVNPATYILFKHGRKGILGWLSIQAFCFTRIIGNILVLKDGDKSTAATIVNSIGLSPLLIGTVGIIHEARAARHPKLQRGREWCFVLNFHGMISVAMVLIVLGIIHMIGNTATNTSDLLMKIGMVIMVICYQLCWVYLLFSFRSSQQELSSPAFDEGTTLLKGTIFALPFIGVRLVYGIIIFIDDLNNKETSTFATSKPLKYVLSAIPEGIAIVIFCYIGIKARHINKLLKASKYTVVEGMHGNQGSHDQVPLTYMPPPQQQGIPQESMYEPYKQQHGPQTTVQSY